MLIRIMAIFMAQQTASTDLQWNTVAIINGRMNGGFLSFQIWIHICFSLNLSILSRAQRQCPMKGHSPAMVCFCEHSVWLDVLLTVLFIPQRSSLLSTSEVLQSEWNLSLVDFYSKTPAGTGFQVLPVFESLCLKGSKCSGPSSKRS